MSKYSVVNDTVTRLRAVLTDVKTGRAAASKNWIYGDFPFLTGRSWPRVGVECPTGPAREIGMNGNHHFEEQHLVQLSVVVKSQKGITTSPGNVDLTPRQILEDITDDIRNNMQSQATIDYFLNLGYKKPVAVDAGNEDHTQKGFIINRMIYRIRERRTG